MKYHITITNNENGDVFFDGDTAGLVANILEDGKIKTLTLIKTNSINTARLCHRMVLAVGEIFSSNEEIALVFNALMKETINELDDLSEEEIKTYVE